MYHQKNDTLTELLLLVTMRWLGCESTPFADVKGMRPGIHPIQGCVYPPDESMRLINSSEP